MFEKSSSYFFIIVTLISFVGCTSSNKSRSKIEDQKPPPVAQPLDVIPSANILIPPSGDDNILSEPKSGKVLLKDALKDGLKVRVLDSQIFAMLVGEKNATLVSGNVAEKVAAELSEGFTACTLESATEKDISIEDLLEPFDTVLLEESEENIPGSAGKVIKLFTSKVELMNSKGTYLITFFRLRAPNTLIDIGVATMNVLEFYYPAEDAQHLK